MRGCCALSVALVVVLVVAVILAVRALAAPDLGAPPRGPDHGGDQTAIAISLSAELVPQLLLQPSAAVTLSEHDLTVLIDEHASAGLTGATARVRDGQILVSGQHPLGPFTVTPVAHLTLSLDPGQSPPALTSRVVELDVGQLGVPGFISDRVLGSLASSIDLDPLFGASPALQLLRANLECVAVVDNGQQAGLRIGVHRPGAGADTTVCAS